MSTQEADKSLSAVVYKCQKPIRALKTVSLEFNQFSEIRLKIIIRKN